MSTPLEPYLKLAKENERLKQTNARLASENRNFRRSSGGFMIDESVDQLREMLAENHKHPLLSRPTKYKVPKPPSPPVFSKSHHEEAIKVWSDWHISEVVKPEDCGGFNAYNSVIAANRVWEDTDKSKRILTAHQSLYPIKKLHFFNLGDSINGSIHKELELTNDLLDIPAAILAAKLMALGIEEYKTLGIPIEMDCVVGNHPRTTHTMPTKRQAHLSLDYFVYENLATYFRNDDQVKITIHTGQVGSKDILGHRYIIEHGIGVPHMKEEAFEDRIRALYDDPLWRKANGDFKGASFEQIVIGNMHRPKFLERTVVNGSLVGQNELGVSWRLKPIRAQQMLWGVSKSLPRTWQYAIDTTENRSMKADNPIGEFATWYMKHNHR
jgi:hypothetical protein